MRTPHAIQLSQGSPERAIDNAERALAVPAETGHRLGRARAHLAADHAHRAVGDDRKAHTHQRRALALFTEIGALDRSRPRLPRPLGRLRGRRST